jgi:hypothetical protein
MPSATYSRSSILTLLMDAFGACGARLFATGALTTVTARTKVRALPSRAAVSGSVPTLGAGDDQRSPVHAGKRGMRRRCAARWSTHSRQS